MAFQALPPENHTISGTIKYYDGLKKVSGAKVILEDKEGNQLADVLTNAAGNYQFNDLSASGNYAVRVEKQGVELVMDGNQKITKLEINPELLSPERKERLEEIIKELQNEAIGKVQRLMAEKMRSLGNFNLPGLS